MVADRRDGFAFLAEYERERLAVAFAHEDDDLALAGLFLCGAAINALRNLVLRLNVAAEVCAVDFLLGGVRERDLALFGLDCFAEFVRERTNAVLYWQFRSRLSCSAA